MITYNVLSSLQSSRNVTEQTTVTILKGLSFLGEAGKGN